MIAPTIHDIPHRDTLDRLLAQTAHLGSETRGITEVSESARHVPGNDGPDRPHLHVYGRMLEFPLEALPPAAAEYAFALTRNGLPAQYVGPSMLAVLATAIGGRVQVEVNEDARSARASLWIALVGEPGSAKTPSILKVRQPLDELDTRKAANYRQEREAWRGLSRADQQRTPKPTLQRLTVGDATIEVLIRALDQNPSGLGVLHDELAGLVKSLGQYKRGGGSDRAHLLSMWSSSPVSYDRVTDEVFIYLPAPVLSILGGIQPGLLNLLDGDDGLSGRWLYSTCPNEATEYDDEHSLRHQKAEWGQLCRDVLRGARGKDRTITLTDDERARFTSVRKRMDKMCGKEDGLVRHWLAKAADHYLRLTLVLAESRNPGSGRIGMDAMDGAEMLLEYFLEQVRRLPVKHENLMLAPYLRGMDEAVDRLASWLGRQPGRVASRRDILRNHVGGVRTSDEAHKLLERYEQVYPGHVVSMVSGGQATELVHAPGHEAV